MVEPVALRDRPGQPVGESCPRSMRTLLGRRPAAGGRPRSRDSTWSARRELELEQDVGQEARPGARAARGRDAVPGLLRVRRGRGGRPGRGRAGLRPVGTGAGTASSACGSRCSRAARRITSTRGRPAEPALKGPGALAHQDLQSVDDGAPPLARSGQERRVAVPGDEVHHDCAFPEVIGLQVQVLERGGVAVQAHGGAVDEHVGGVRAPDGADAEVGGQRRGPLRACGSRPRRRPRPPSRSAQATARALPPAPRTSAVRPRTAPAPPSASSSPGASVLSACDRARRAVEGQRVRGADRARAASVAVVGQRERRLLVRDRHVRAGEARPGQRADRLGERARAGPAAAGSASRPGRGARAPRCASPASGCARRASRGRRGAAGSAASTGRLPPSCGALGVVGGDVALNCASVAQKSCAPLPHGLTT